MVELNSETEQKIQKLNYIFGVSAMLLSGARAAIFVFSFLSARLLLMYDVKLYTDHKKVFHYKPVKLIKISAGVLLYPRYYNLPILLTTFYVIYNFSSVQAVC